MSVILLNGAQYRLLIKLINLCGITALIRDHIIFIRFWDSRHDANQTKPTFRSNAALANPSAQTTACYANFVMQLTV